MIAPAALALSLLFGADPAETPELPVPEARSSWGVATRFGAGAVRWDGEVGKYSTAGYALHLAAGWGWPRFPWLELSVGYDGALTPTAQPPPPGPGAFSLHAVMLELRGRIPVWRFALGAGVSAGEAWLGPNVLLRAPDNTPDESGAHHHVYGGTVSLEWLLEHPRFTILLEARGLQRDRTAGRALSLGLGLGHRF